MSRADALIRSWPIAVALALLLAALATLGFAMTRATGGRLIYPLDDTYIQMAIAKTLAAHGTWGVTRFEFSGAGSSPLWPPLLASLDRLTRLGARLPIIVNAVAAVLLVTIAFAGLRRHIANRAAQALTLMLVIVAAPLPALALIGMEHTLASAAALALALSGVSLCVAPPAHDRRLLAAVALLGLMTTAFRYDAASIVVALVLLIAVSRGWRRALPLAIASALPAAAYAAMAWRHGWPAVPAPILLKQRLWGVSLRSWHGAADVLGGGALTVLVNTPALLVLVIVAAALVAVSPRGAEERLAHESRLLLLVFLIATAVHLEFGRVGWLYRYEAYLVVLGVVAIASALTHQQPARWPPFDAIRWSAAAALAAILLFPLVLRGVLASRAVVAGAAELYRHEYAWSRFFARYSPDGGLLVTDVGAVSYFTDVPIVDAAGLATRELLPARWTDPVDVPLAVRIARSRGVRVSIIDGPLGGALTGWPCVAAWTTAGDTTPNATIWLSAADAEAASHLARDLRAFSAGESTAGFSLRFADARGGCTVP